MCWESLRRATTPLLVLFRLCPPGAMSEATEYRLFAHHLRVATGAMSEATEYRLFAHHLRVPTRAMSEATEYRLFPHHLPVNCVVRG